MIIKASQRGGANKLALHLLNTKDNEHVEVHQLRGYVADDLQGALQESYAISRATRCRQFMFSVSLNPPQDESVKTELFETVSDRIEQRMGLEHQPRAMVFHEKEGRRHAHVVWSRIDTDEMKAINLPYFKNQMMEVSKEVYLEQEWKMPKGFVDREQRNPLNFSRDQWQQAKRLKEDPRSIKTQLRESWISSNDREEFTQALERKGFYLAKGDRRGFVAVDWRGETYSLSRWTGQNKKALEAKLGSETDLMSVDETRKQIDEKLVTSISTLQDELRAKQERNLESVMNRKAAMQQLHEEERSKLREEQVKEAQLQVQIQQARIQKGWRGLLDRITGKRKEIEEQNLWETEQRKAREREAKDRLIETQREHRQRLQQEILEWRSRHHVEQRELKEDVFRHVGEEQRQMIDSRLEDIKQDPNHLEQGQFHSNEQVHATDTTNEHDVSM